MAVSKLNTVPSVATEPKVQESAPEISVTLSKEKKNTLVIEVPLHAPKDSVSGKTKTVFHSKTRTKITVGGSPIYITMTGFIYPKG